MASIGHIVSHVGSEGTSPGTEASEPPHNSLLSELDTSYRILIEKYEALLEAREQQQKQEQQQETYNSPESADHSSVDGMSGPMSILVTNPTAQNISLPSKCQRCSTCTCDFEPSVLNNSKGSTLDLSEVDTTSSGISEGENHLISKSTQTREELSVSQAEILDDLTPTIHSKCLDLSSPVNPCDKRFQSTPEYKKLFQEIFTVLKKTVDEKDIQSQPPKSCKASQKTDITNDKTVSVPTPSRAKEHNDIKVDGQPVIFPVEEETENSKSLQSEGKTDTNQDNPNFGSKSFELKEVIISSEHSDTVSGECPNTRERIEKQITSASDSEQNSVDIRPLRPDTLDLSSGGGSRPSSRQRRRRRQQQMAQLNPCLQQQQPQATDNSRNVHQSYHVRQQHHSHQKYQKRDRDGLHHHNYYNHRQQDDLPDIHPQDEGAPVEVSKTRVVYNSSRGGGRCDHHRSRKHHRSQQENAEQRHSGSDTEFKRKPATTKINYPSVEVARLRKLEMTYAEVLKNSMNRSFYDRRY